MSSFVSWLALLTVQSLCSLVLISLTTIALGKVVDEYRVLNDEQHGRPTLQNRGSNAATHKPSPPPPEPVPPLRLTAVRSNSSQKESQLSLKPIQDSEPSVRAPPRRLIMDPSIVIAVDVDHTQDIPEQLELEVPTKGTEDRNRKDSAQLSRLTPSIRPSMTLETPSSSNHSMTPRSKKPWKSGRSSVSGRRRSSLSVHSAQQLADRKNPKTFLLWFAIKLSAVCFCFSFCTVIQVSTLLGLGPRCRLSGKIASSVFQMGKGTAFSMYVDRVRTVFRGSKFEYSSRVLDLLTGLIWTSTLGFSAAWFFIVVNSDESVNGVRWANNCQMQVLEEYSLLPLAGLLTEIAIEVTTLNMFTIPLRKLIKRLVRIDESTKDMAQLASKTNVLTSVMVFSMSVSILIIIVSNNYLAGPISAVVFCVCLMMFPHWFDEWYPILCSVPIAMMDHCCGRLPIQELMHHPSELIQNMQKQMSELSLSNTRSRNRSKH